MLLGKFAWTVVWLNDVTTNCMLSKETGGLVVPKFCPIIVIVWSLKFATALVMVGAAAAGKAKLNKQAKASAKAVARELDLRVGFIFLILDFELTAIRFRGEPGDMFLHLSILLRELVGEVLERI